MRPHTLAQARALLPGSKGLVRLLSAILATSPGAVVSHAELLIVLVFSVFEYGLCTCIWEWMGLFLRRNGCAYIYIYISIYSLVILPENTNQNPCGRIVILQSLTYFLNYVVVNVCVLILDHTTIYVSSYYRSLPV